MLQSRKIASLCSLLLIPLASACGDEGDGHEPLPPQPVLIDAGTSTPPPQPPPQPVPYDDVVELVVRNQTTRIVYKLYASPSIDERWGPNLLDGELLFPGGAASFLSNYCDAYYDLKAVDVAGNTIVRANRIYFRCGTRETVTLL